MRLYALSLILITLSSCALWNRYVKKPKPPVCPLDIVSLEAERNITRILVFGDGLGDSPGASETAPMARSICDSLGGCHFGLYTADVYPSGANTESELEEKVLGPTSYFDFPVYFSLGNHEYYGNPQSYYELLQKHSDLRLPCNQYDITDDVSYTISVIDTNWPDQSRQPEKLKRMCDAVGFRIFLGHLPLWSNGAHKKRDEEEAETRYYFEKVMRECGDVYLAGHDHHQELIRKDNFIQVVQGGFGRSLRAVERGVEDQLFIAESYGFSILEIPKANNCIERMIMDEELTDCSPPIITFYNEKGEELFFYPFD